MPRTRILLPSILEAMALRAIEVSPIERCHAKPLAILMSQYLGQDNFRRPIPQEIRHQAVSTTLARLERKGYVKSAKYYPPKNEDQPNPAVVRRYRITPQGEKYILRFYELIDSFETPYEKLCQQIKDNSSF